MKLQLPDEIADVAVALRTLEQDTQKLPAPIRAAMVKAAQDLDDWRALGQDIARDVEGIVNLRISMMASESAHAEQQRNVRSALVSMLARLKERLA